MFKLKKVESILKNDQIHKYCMMGPLVLMKIYDVPGSFQVKSKKISNNQELIQSDPISCPQNQKGNN